MSVLKVNQIRSKLRSMFEEHLDLTDISPSDKGKDDRILSRCLAAFAIYLEAGCSEAEAARAVWDGSEDNGIDAAYYDHSDTRVILVQSKWINKGTGEPPSKDISVFLDGVRDVIEQDFEPFASRLHGKLSDLTMRLATPGTRVQLIIVTTGAGKLSKPSRTKVDKAAKELNGVEPDPLVSYDLLGLSRVFSGLVNDPTQGRVALDATILDWSIVPSPHLAYYGTIDGLQLKEWWKKHGKRLETIS